MLVRAQLFAPMERNLTITISGPSGSGKSTLLTLIEDALMKRGVNVSQMDIRTVQAVQLDDMTSLREHPSDQEDAQTALLERYERMNRAFPEIKGELRVLLQTLTTRPNLEIPAS